MPNSRFGLALPLPADFDTDAHIYTMNKVSIAFTRSFAAARAAGSIGILDVGAKLLPYYEYSTEKALLVGSARVVATTGLLPIFITIWVAVEQLKASAASAAEKSVCDEEREAREADKAKAFRPIKGTLLIENPHPISSTIPGPAHVPAAYHTSLANKIYFPLHWWSDRTLQHVTNFLHTLPTKPLTVGQIALLSAPATGIVNVKKALLELGDEDVGLLTPSI
ncbi:hypothetical protein B0H17DRAFT_1217621 [Mycena rosella]|uniref:Uncharacterized protein n=1 Tax=Mycena rosella TaxID=1033263 RepID=A0AAD7BVT2_MYCRO|nr:hypothetical protein B0H17DRAFT_1217621 [Mycena rosella]